MRNAVVEKNELIESDVKILIDKADLIIENTIKKINYEIIKMYFQLGKMIFEYKEENNSKYGDSVLEKFNIELSSKYGVGFGITNIWSSIKFYDVFKKIPTSEKLENVTWSHIREIINIGNLDIIKFYLKEVNAKKLTILELRTSIKSKAFERTISNQTKGKPKNIIEKTLKDPMILNIKNRKRSERELEDEIVKNISNFKKEIGNIVTFLDRQYKININGLIHKVDLVFLDYETDTFILVDLKINKVTNHDVMQMQLYIEYFSKEIKNKHTNVIGLILCETKDLRLIENKNIYQIKYLNEIPKDKELLKIINDNKIILLKTENLKLEGVSNE